MLKFPWHKFFYYLVWLVLIIFTLQYININYCSQSYESAAEIWMKFANMEKDFREYLRALVHHQRTVSFVWCVYFSSNLYTMFHSQCLFRSEFKVLHQRFIGESCKSGMLPCCLLLNWNWTMVIAFSALKQGYLLITLPWPYMVNNIGIELDKDVFSFSIFLIGGHN